MNPVDIGVVLLSLIEVGNISAALILREDSHKGQWE
jgi:hypothetical protein